MNYYRLTTLFFLSGLLALFSACDAPEDAPQGRVIQSDDTPIDELLDRSGTNTQVVLLPDKILTEAEDQMRKGTVQVDEVRAILREAFNPGDLRLYTRQYLIDNLSPEEVDAALEWLRSDLGRRISALEVAGLQPQAHSKAMSQYNELRKNESRVALVRELSAVKSAPEYTVDLLQEMDRAMMRALAPSVPPERRVTEAEFETKAASARPGLLERHGKTIEALYLHSYQSLSDEALQRYIEFAKTDEAIQYHQALAKSVQAAVAIASGQAGSKIAALTAAGHSTEE